MRLILLAQKIQIPLNQLANTSFYTMPPASTHLATVSCDPLDCSRIPRGPETIPPCPQYPLQWPDSCQVEIGPGQILPPEFQEEGPEIFQVHVVCREREVAQGI